MKKFISFIIAGMFLAGCSIVGPGQRGVRVSMGSVSEDPKPPGAYLWIPVLMGMTKINVQLQKSEISSTGGTKDMQDVHAKVAVNWSLSPENVVRTYKNIGDEDEVEARVLIPAVNEVMKAATAKRTAEEVLTKRLEMKKDIDEALSARLAQYGITVTDVSVVNLEFSQEFARAIESKQIAEQEAKRASYIAQKATQEGLAEIERAKGQAEAQKLLRSSLTPEILQQRAIEKWNGSVPSIMGSGSNMLFNIPVNGKN